MASRRRCLASLGAVPRQVARRCHRSDARPRARRPRLPRARRRGRRRRAVAGGGAPRRARRPCARHRHRAGAARARRRRCARRRAVGHLETRELDGEALDTLPAASFDVVVSRVGLIYFPDQQRALAGMRHALKPGGRVAAIVYSTPERNAFFSIPVKIIRERAQLPPPLPGQPGPFSLGGDGVLEAAFAKAGLRDDRSAQGAVAGAAAERGRMRALRARIVRRAAPDDGRAGRSRPRAACGATSRTRCAPFEADGGFVGPCEMLVGVGDGVARRGPPSVLSFKLEPPPGGGSGEQSVRRARAR